MCSAPGLWPHSSAGGTRKREFIAYAQRLRLNSARVALLLVVAVESTRAIARVRRATFQDSGLGRR